MFIFLLSRDSNIRPKKNNSLSRKTKSKNQKNIDSASQQNKIYCSKKRPHHQGNYHEISPTGKPYTVENKPYNKCYGKCKQKRQQGKPCFWCYCFDYDKCNQCQKPNHSDTHACNNAVVSSESYVCNLFFSQPFFLFMMFRLQKIIYSNTKMICNTLQNRYVRHRFSALPFRNGFV